MDQELAKSLFEEGAALVLLDVPEKTEFGIDYNSWTVGPKFKGVKMIPPGFHFIFYSAVSKQGQAAPRTGFFHFFQRKEVLVRRWDPKVEDITQEGIGADIADRIKENLKSFDPCLGAYPFESLSKWVSLTNHISQGLVTRIQPASGRISAVTQVQSENYVQPPCSTGGNEATGSGKGEGGGAVGGASEEEVRGDEMLEAMSEEGEEALVDKDGGERTDVFAGVGKFSSSSVTPATPQRPRPPKPPQLKDLNMKQVKEAALRLSSIPRQKYPEGATPSQITHHNMDLSFSMATMLTQEYNNDEKGLLGELQFSFVCFLVGHVYDAFEHWKELVKLICFSEDALSTRTQLFLDFITVLHFQLKEIPEDFFVDIVSRSNFLTVTLQAFFSSLEESGGQLDPGLVKRGLQFRDNLTKKYKWDFSSEPEDFAPTVVDLADPEDFAPTVIDLT